MKTAATIEVKHIKLRARRVWLWRHRPTSSLQSHPIFSSSTQAFALVSCPRSLLFCILFALFPDMESGDKMRVIMAVVVTVMALKLTPVLVVEAQQFSLVHRYAQLAGSPANSRGQGASPEYSAMLSAHDRRRLAVIDFPLGGNYLSVGLYYTQISLGTPPRQFHVHVDTGSDVLWLNCVPCNGCPVQTTIPGITLRRYDPALSSTFTALGCDDPRCLDASNGGNISCTTVPQNGCHYAILYGENSTTQGYIVNDVLTYVQGDNTSGSANILFGCGTTQTGRLQTGTGDVDGLIGLGQASIAVPTQLADQGFVNRAFAHCLQGDSTIGGGTLVIGNVQEPGITYTPIVPNQSHYNVYLQNIGVNGVNITTPASFTITASNGGVIMDSGTTLVYLIEPAYTEFVTAISNGAPVASQQIPSGDGSPPLLCWAYTGDIATSFPSVQLFFDGGAVMPLAAQNYLSLIDLPTGGSVYCMQWLTSTDYTILGDIVLRDQLIVYDNSNQVIGWKPFDCTQPITAV